MRLPNTSAETLDRWASLIGAIILAGESFDKGTAGRRNWDLVTRWLADAEPQVYAQGTLIIKPAPGLLLTASQAGQIAAVLQKAISIFDEDVRLAVLPTVMGIHRENLAKT